MIADFSFELRTKVIFGCGVFAKLGEEAVKLGCKKWLIVADKNVSSLGFPEKAAGFIKNVGFDSVIYDEIFGEPTVINVNEGVQVFKAESCDGIIGIGGGSAIDCAKAISCMLANPGKFSDYRGMHNVPNRGPNIIAIPTTSGTGAEVTLAAGIIDTETNLKIVAVDKNMTAATAIVDPELVRSLPKRITAQTGVDALTHGIEAYISKYASPVSDTLALKAIGLIGANLYDAWNDGDDMDARSAVMLGQMIAGMAVGNAQVCLVHALSRPLGVYFNIPHGLGNSILLSPVTRFSISGNVKRYADIARTLDASLSEADDETAAKRLADILAELSEKLKLPRISDMEIDIAKYKRLVSQMAKDCIASGSPANNPVVPTQEQIEALYLGLIS